MIRRLLVLAVILLLIVAVGVVLIARGAIGGDTLRRELERQLTAHVGQPVTIGSLSASFFPRVAMDLRNVSVGGDAGAGIEQLSIATGLRGLFSRRVENAEVVLSNSRIPVAVAAGIAGTMTSGGLQGGGETGLTIVSVTRLAFERVELIGEGRSLTVDLDASITGDRLEITRLSAQSEGTRLDATGALTSVSNRQGRFTASAGRLNLDELLAVVSALSKSASSGPTQTGPLDLTVELTAPGGELAGYTFQTLTSTIRVTAEHLLLEPLRFAMFNGQLEGRLRVASNANPADITLSGRVNGMNVATILQSTGGGASMTGSLSGTVALASRGTSTEEIIGRASGTGAIAIVDGAIPGLEMVRAVVLAFGKPSGAPPAGSGSAFTRLAGTFALADQTLRSQDISFTSRDFDMAGAALVRLPVGTVDMRASVVLSRELTAQAGTDLRRYAQEDGRVVVPALITGSVASPSVSIDVAAALNRALQNEMKRRVKGFLDRIIR